MKNTHSLNKGIGNTGSWIRPSSHISEGGWSGATKAYDGNLSTYATRGNWGGYLHLMMTQPATCSKIRVYVSGSAASNVVIYAALEGRPYTLIHNGAIPQNQWFEISVSGQLQGISISHTANATLKLHEVEFYIIGEPPPACVEGEYKYEGLDIYQCLNGEWVLIGQLEATVNIISPSYGETIPAPPVVQFYVESNSPRPRYAIVCEVYYNGQHEKTYILPSRYPCPDDPNSTPSGNGYIVTRELMGISEDRYVELGIRILHDNTLIYTNEDNPRVFLTGAAPPPEPPDYVNTYYYMQDYFPQDVDASIYPVYMTDYSDVPYGYWFTNQSNSRMLYYNDDTANSGYLYKIIVNLSNNTAEFYRSVEGSTVWTQITDLPYDIVSASIDAISLIYSNIPPVAILTVDKTSALVGETITFDASSSYDEDGEIVEIDYDFGDGSYVYNSPAAYSHTYDTPGVYTATVTVIDSLSGETSKSVQIIVYGGAIAELDLNSTTIVDQVTAGEIVDLGVVYVKNVGDVEGKLHLKLVENPGSLFSENTLLELVSQSPVGVNESTSFNLTNIQAPSETGVWSIGIKVWSEHEAEPGWVMASKINLVRK